MLVNQNGQSTALFTTVNLGLSCLYNAVVSVPSSLVITCWERADLLDLLCVMFSCVLSFPIIMVSLVRCGT